ncbi:MAG: NAD(P)/FAD-dependent oxidoreductase [Campylobacterales bacterium]|nr:NAD(P)/FAD-dependent oxidoreductase [Campylobacterales bacterium]
MAKKVAIVGGGASGLICAIFCAKAGLNVELFEQNTKLAKKILVSGNGRCNIINREFTSANYISSNPEFVNYALKQFDFHAFESFVNSLGLLLEQKADGKCYPLSNEAKSVAKLFEESAKNNGVHITQDTKIENIQKLLNSYDAVVIATGSEAASHLGGNRDGMNFAESLGHTVMPTYPTLVQLHLDSPSAYKMAGAKVDGEVSLLINRELLSQIKGDVLFTNYGVSGFSILDISSRASEALLNFETVEISINLLPNFPAQKLAAHIQNIAKLNPSLHLIDVLVGLLPVKIVKALLEELELSFDLCGEAIGTKLTKKIANKLVNWRFHVSDTHGFRHAEASGGGVNTHEINPKTMESLLVRNLYFVGEVVDVVGERGGYNFAWAWASGVLAAKSISKE